MQVVILCGGKGTRLSEYTEEIPKPLVEVGDKPILHHLMDAYARHGHKEFILCLGYKGNKIEEYFKDNRVWSIEFAHTGEDSNKAERLRKVKNKINSMILDLKTFKQDIKNKTPLYQNLKKDGIILFVGKSIKEDINEFLEEAEPNKFR